MSKGAKFQGIGKSILGSSFRGTGIHAPQLRGSEGIQEDAEVSMFLKSIKG